MIKQIIRSHIFQLVLSSFLSMTLSAQQGEKISREQYIEEYAELAMKEMARTGIPASITLAQGCLESDNGNSRLAVKANNHFGIKCHDWNGQTIYHDDDKRNECFRKYKSAYDSYMDHSEFLTTKSRYAFLFDLQPDDYKQWARGLKKASYATSHTYADLLISIIEENELYIFDQVVLAGGEFKPGLIDSLSLGGAREIHIRNRIEYIIVQAGDTPDALRDELDLYRNELYRYNDLEKGAKLVPGQILYLQPKRRKAEPGYNVHIVKEGETMYDISQQYGVKMKHLYRINQWEEGIYLPVGTEVYLRKKSKVPSLKPQPVEEDPEEELMFEFDR